jgi:hypothetical protein
MRIMKLGEWKIFLKDEYEVDFVAYLGKHKIVDRELLLMIECRLREVLRREREAENEDMLVSYAENQRPF